MLSTPCMYATNIILGYFNGVGENLKIFNDASEVQSTCDSSFPL